MAVLAVLLVPAAQSAPRLDFARTALEPGDVAVVINDRDPYSREVGQYYATRRGIPSAQVIRVSFEPDTNLPRAEFERIHREVEARLPASVQAYALAWRAPWKVDCMSVTSAFAFGFDRAFCSDTQCAPTRSNPIFDGATIRPYDSNGVRPAMLLASASVAEARELIERGLSIEGQHPQGTAYLVSTPDVARNARAAIFDRTVEALSPRIPVRVVEGRGIGDRADALFYFTGAANVPELARLRLMPGALGDHLTSFGGVLDDGRQMSALRWLAAGASASYGTVVEPCSHPQKFPVPAVAMSLYLAGATALEAYWKSVAWPGEGVFVGDPLARPFAPHARALDDRSVSVTLHVPVAGHLVLYGADSPIGPFRPKGGAVALAVGRNEAVLRGLDQPFYRAVVLSDQHAAAERFGQ